VLGVFGGLGSRGRVKNKKEYLCLK